MIGHGDKKEIFTINRSIHVIPRGWGCTKKIHCATPVTSPEAAGWLVRKSALEQIQELIQKSNSQVII